MTGAKQKHPRETFRIYLIKPSHYDDDGYVIQWARSDIPANTLSVLNGIALDCAERRVLGENVDIEITNLDEVNIRVKPKDVIRDIQSGGGKGMVALVGVQSNQFPRAVDIARPFIAVNIPVCLGGFHASGCLSMLAHTPPEIQEAMDLGISIFAGEAEGRLDQVLQDAYCDTLKPLYNFMADLPGLEGAPVPVVADETLERRITTRASFDSGRGCPFQCSFCTIINVQGRKSRYRTADEVERFLRDNYARGIKKFLISDDNFARNKNWEAIFDRMIELREGEGLKFSYIIQVDTLCHKIPNFIEKAGRAGVNRVFVGMESINPDTLAIMKKKQNRITEYRTMFQAWKDIGAVTWAGFIIGFPNDTYDSVMADIEIIKRELPVDMLEFFILTPLPGSEDHKVLDAKGVWMDPDMNIYDLEHVTTHHPIMSDEELQSAYRDSWHRFYTPEHVETILRRDGARGVKVRKLMKFILYFYGSHAIEGIHALQCGLFRFKFRRDRRPGMPIENPVTFYARYLTEIVTKTAQVVTLKRKYERIRSRIEADPNKAAYSDIALTPATDDDFDDLEMFSSDAAHTAVDKALRKSARTAAIAAAE
jgi:radical SAM superfamily enzyme YgiQ (UPF0313 family)